MRGEETLDEDDECLRTRRLFLRPARASDEAAIAHLANDRHIAEMTARIPHPYGLEDARRFLADHGEEHVFAIERRGAPGLIGLAGLTPNQIPGTFELGYWLGRPFWGEGFATEAAQGLIDHAFTGLGAECVEVRCRVVNGGSRRVIQKCGFQYFGTSMDISLAAGRVASETYRMDRRCWQSLKSWGGR
ncbi:GNAT family N-acetyltransferase [Aureimonas populi]|uniref:GNAT family N-acetyltransferase n=1 Tax=Aureimonas populi TaxID=1701758 RepID=A0ABW5CQP1_9HYPH|nr:GNAT family N-acetyltransferase [Aureimonas populi]